MIARLRRVIVAVFGREIVAHVCTACGGQQIRKKMVEIVTREASSCDIKELVHKLIPVRLRLVSAAAQAHT